MIARSGPEGRVTFHSDHATWLDCSGPCVRRLEFVLFDGRVYEFRTSVSSTAVDTRHVSSSDDSDLFGKVESDPFWPYKKGDALCSFLLKNFPNIRGDSASLWSHFPIHQLFRVLILPGKLSFFIARLLRF